MILQLQAKVHGLGNLRVLSTTYAILSLFKDPFFPPYIPPSLTINLLKQGGRSYL